MESVLSSFGNPKIDSEDCDKEKQSRASGEKMEKASAFWRWTYQVLLKPQVIICAAVIDNLLVNVEATNIMKQLVKLDLLNQVKALFPLSNRAFTYIEFTDENCAKIFQNRSSFINNMKILFVNPETPAKFLNIFIEKLPVDLLREHLPIILKEWGEVINITPTFMKLTNGKSYETGSSKVRFKLKNECTSAEIPYFIKIDRLKVYIHIPQRQKICFRCLSPDHLVSSCSFKFCTICRAYKGLSHLCGSSYAQKVSNSLNSWQASFLQAQEDSVIADTVEIISKDKNTTKSSECTHNPPSAVLDANSGTLETLQVETESCVDKKIESSKIVHSNVIQLNKSTVIGEKLSDSVMDEIPIILNQELKESSSKSILQSQPAKRVADESLSNRGKRKSQIEHIKTYSLRNKTKVQSNNLDDEDSDLKSEQTQEEMITDEADKDSHD